ncbi:MAG: LamG domain-containing protein [Candidatus Poribacteria bacterium]|nr:LamG domain-containing protein [Candidatus Poribacteria bacterium]
MGRQILMCLSISLLSLNFVDAAEKGLTAYWPMDGDAKDASGNGHDGIVQGAKFVDGVVGKAAKFDGGGTWINGGRKRSLEVSPMSCMFWMRPSHDLGPRDPRFNIVYQAKGPMFAFNKQPVANEPNGPKNTIRCWVDTVGNIPKGTLFTKRDKWRAGVWYHLACTYDEKELVLYEDGVETGRVKATGAIGVRGSEFRIAKPFAGSIDEVRLYDRALSAKEIAVLGGLAVEPHGKITTVWGSIKTGQK